MMMPFREVRTMHFSGPRTLRSIPMVNFLLQLSRQMKSSRTRAKSRQVDTPPLSDGHSGPETARYINENLFRHLLTIGSCCLVAVIWKGILYTTNVGDSRAVLGSLNTSNRIVAEQLTRDPNACTEEVRKELKALHPDDSQIVVLKQEVRRIKGIIQVASQETFGTLCAIVRSRTKNRQIGFLTNRHMAVDLEYPS